MHHREKLRRLLMTAPSGICPLPALRALTRNNENLRYQHLVLRFDSSPLKAFQPGRGHRELLIEPYDLIAAYILFSIKGHCTLTTQRFEKVADLSFLQPSSFTRADGTRVIPAM